MLEYFGDIHRTIGESLVFKQPLRPSFLLKHSLLASKPVLAIYKISTEVSPSYSKYKGKNLSTSAYIFSEGCFKKSNLNAVCFITVLLDGIVRKKSC